MPPLVVIGGPAGSGKSTVGTLLAEALQVPFIDADDLHPPSNIARMTLGLPLRDEDRWPWLRTVGSSLATSSATGLVVACSVLRKAYRDSIAAQSPETLFILLTASRALLAARLRSREGHFMNVNMLSSQLLALEPLGELEHGLSVSAERAPADIVQVILRDGFHWDPSRPAG